MCTLMLKRSTVIIHDILTNWEFNSLHDNTETFFKRISQIDVSSQIRNN